MSMLYQSRRYDLHALHRTICQNAHQILRGVNWTVATHRHCCGIDSRLADNKYCAEPRSLRVPYVSLAVCQLHPP